MVTDRDIAKWRMRSQRLVAPHATSVPEVVDGLLAVQAENPSQATWAIVSRTHCPDAGDLDGLLDEGRVVRTHVLRPTWHFVATEDIGWLLELTAPRVRPVVLRQLTDTHGMDPAGLDRATSVVLDALLQQPDQTRDQLADGLREAGMEPTGQMLMLLLALLELDRLICSGRRVAATTHTYACFADRVPSSRSLDREEALAELALRYFTGHGPATERDLAYWATLTLTDVRRGLGHVRDRLASFEHEGRTYWHAPDETPTGTTEPSGHLLQLLDELYRGYQESRMVLDSDSIVPSGGETAIGMALVDAQMVARMRRTVGRRVVFELSPYGGSLSAQQRWSLEEAATRYAEFLGLEHELRVR
jgi:hypothetical protein